MARGMTWEWQDGSLAGRVDDDRPGDGEGVPQESGKRMITVTVENGGTNF